MSTEVYVIYGLAVILTTVGLIKSPTKTKLGLKLTLIMNLTILIVFVISSYLIDYVISIDEVEKMLDKTS
ncbi:hypothetical protein BN85314250 [Paracholeplasma brassicae]|uniref:Uncharacterized protein n=1 Tax=Acholeplasma brassicae TaxID=61635 RepID=U4KQ03_9MOLU|nr:hypothetical protein [Paracholeplasma brassicae]CCV66446.1 hypothetical protein BN85314250 [Paracholeplasma brassicae]